MNLKKRTKLFRIKLLVVVLFWLLTFIVLASCTCIALPSYISEGEFQNSDVIIKGKVVYVNLNDAKDSAFTVFKVEENYTPEKFDAPVLKVKLPIAEELCGIEFETGESWIVFAYPMDSIYTTSKCSRTIQYISPADYKAYNDRFIEVYHKNILFLKSKMQ